MATLREVFITELTRTVHGKTTVRNYPVATVMAAADIEALADRLLQILHIHGKILGPLDYIDAEDPPWHF